MSNSSFIRLGCGIDASKDKSYFLFSGYTSDGDVKCISSKSVKMQPAEIKKAVKWIIDKRHKADPEGTLPFQIVMESTSRYHEKLLFALHEAKLPVCLPQGRLLKKYIASLPWNSKNDPLDAKGLAHYACCRKSILWAPFSKKTLELRDLLRARKSLKSSQVRLQNQIHALSYAKFTHKEIERSYKRLVKQLLREIEKLEATILDIYAKDEKLREKVETIVKDVKGLGLLTVLTVATETNGFANVNSGKQLAKYAGYDIVQNESGNFKGKTRMSKRGNKHIRVAMYMAAVSHIQHGEGHIINAYQRGRAKKPDIYKHANVIVQRKLLLLIYTLWTTDAAYDPFHIPVQCQPKASSHSTEKESTPEHRPEVHGIAPSEEALPFLAQI
jgi:transposase